MTEFQTTYAEVLNVFAETKSLNVVGKWVCGNMAGVGFWGGADWAFAFAFRDFVALCKEVLPKGKHPKTVTFQWDGKTATVSALKGKLAVSR